MPDSDIPGLSNSPGMANTYSMWMYDSATDSDVEVTAAQMQAFLAGLTSFWIPARAMVPAQVNGCAAHSVVAGAANQPDRWVLEFSASTKQHAQFMAMMPKNWDEGAIYGVAVWEHPATSGTFGTRWGIAAVAVSNDDTLAVNFGTAVEVSDTGGTTADAYVSDPTGNITVGGSPQAQDLVYFDVYRDPAHASDDLAVVARLIGVKIYYTKNTTTEA